MTERDLDIVADALVTLSQAPCAASVSFDVPTKGPRSGRSRRERKPPAKLLSGDYVCEVVASKEQHSPNLPNLLSLDSYELDLSYTKHAWRSEQMYTHENNRLRDSCLTLNNDSFLGKRSQHNDFAADVDMFLHMAKKLRGMDHDECEVKGKSGSKRSGGNSQDHAAPAVVQVFAGSVPDDTEAELLEKAQGMLVWDANMYIVPRCPAVRGALKTSTLSVEIGSH